MSTAEIRRLIDALICQHCYRSRPCHCNPEFAAEVRRIGLVRQELVNSYPERRARFARGAARKRKAA